MPALNERPRAAVLIGGTSLHCGRTRKPAAPLGTPDLWTPRNEFRAARWRRGKADVRARQHSDTAKKPSLLSSLACGATFATFPRFQVNVLGDLVLQNAVTVPTLLTTTQPELKVKIPPVIFPSIRLGHETLSAPLKLPFG